MSKLTGIPVASQAVMTFTRNELANIQWEVIVNQVTGPASGMITERISLPGL